MAQIMVKVLVPILLVLVARVVATPPGIAKNPSQASCQIKKYKHCYNLVHVCPKFCPDECTVECVSCKPICVGGGNPTPDFPPTPSTPENPTPEFPPIPSTPENPPPTPSTPDQNPPPSPSENSPPPHSTPSPSPPPPSTPSPSPSPIPSTPEQNSPPPPSIPSPSPPIPSTPENPPPPPSIPSPSPSIPSTPENPPPSPSTPSPSLPTPSTPENSPPTPSPSENPPPTPSTPPSSPTPANPPSSPSPSTPSGSTGQSSSPKTAKCRNKNYPKCYNTKHVCPNACPGGCEVDCHTCKPVCSCDRPGAVCQDPRFIGGDGITFYFHGKKESNFCLVSDPNLHINAHFIGRRNENMKRDFTWVQSIAILFDNHQVFVGAEKTAIWEESIDRLALTFDGESITLDESEGATWKSSNVPGVSIVRATTTNSVIVEVEGRLRITANVVPITEEDSRIHKYGITNEDCFAHLDLGFKFFSLSNEVSGVLGQTYKPNYVSGVNIGAKMPIMGGGKEFETTSLFNPDCSVARFVGNNGSNNEVAMDEGLDLPSLSCASGIDGQGVVCRR
ncbi:uncharacterized protein LOC133286326 [Gastrolobium bilobum]|uniref:uncharacterized protein LOC133286326 n=1 Tax=Gastrolobium bilobum TaxID=150636 RepID=UPI002AB271DD|nr:uncharacterized protein LOC133286326 [Gastrolobium bilobum]